MYNCAAPAKKLGRVCVFQKLYSQLSLHLAVIRESGGEVKIGEIYVRDYRKRRQAI